MKVMRLLPPLNWGFLYKIPSRNPKFANYSSPPWKVCVNLDKRPKGRGTHWTCLWTPNNINYFYMDSYGYPTPLLVLDLIRKTRVSPNSHLIRMSEAIQDDDAKTATCGWFVIHCMHEAGLSLRDFGKWQRGWHHGDVPGNEDRLERWVHSK